MIRKSYAIWCDVKGCQVHTTSWRTRQGANQQALFDGWLLYKDARRRNRAKCPVHFKGI